ncbi:MAG: hypothetical protein N2490_01420 [Ignavibacteria bacterium]|nr:hypothetical protein [Ignavibacteria bacterium]
MKTCKIKTWVLVLFIFLALIFCGSSFAQEEMPEVKFDGDNVIIKKDVWVKLGDCYVYLYDKCKMLEETVANLEKTIKDLKIRIKELEAENNNLKDEIRKADQKIY